MAQITSVSQPSVSQPSVSQPSSARLQTKNTFIPIPRISNMTKLSPSLSTNDENIAPKRTRTASTSSVDTIRPSSGAGKKKASSSKKRARASEPSTFGEEVDPDLAGKLEDIRRTRQRKLSTSSTNTIHAEISTASISFPKLPSSETRSSPKTTELTDVKGKGRDTHRKATPPKLNPGRAAPAAPSVAVTSVSRSPGVSSDIYPPSAIRDAPPPPVPSRSRVASLKGSSRPASPVHRVTVPTYRSAGFEPLPSHLQDWQPSSMLTLLSDDEDGSSCDEGVGRSSRDRVCHGESWKDQWNNIHPGTSDLDLSINFHKKQPFFDVWDLPDDIYIAVPARIHLTVKHSRPWTGYTLSPEPDLRYIDIKCNSFEYRTSPLMSADSGNTSSSGYPPEYTVSYHGASSAEYADPCVVPADLTRGIIINKKWYKTFPGNKIHFKDSLITSYGRLPEDSVETPAVADEESVTSKRGWYFKFMIPIPSWVIRQGNSRAFTVEASAWIGSLDDGGLLQGETELVVSHLRSEREMAKNGTQAA